MHVFILFHNLFDEVGWSCQEHIFLFKTLIHVMMNTLFQQFSFSHASIYSWTFAQILDGVQSQDGEKSFSSPASSYYN